MNILEGSWYQNYIPLGNLWLSGLVALLPILLFFACLVWFKLKGWLAALLTVSLSVLISLFVYKMPFNMVVMSFVQGFLTGLWPIAWIIIAAIFLYKLTVKAGYFDVLKQSVMQITPDQRLQVVLIAFCFGAFLEGAIGFGGPVAITAAILVGLGLRPLYAAGLCMIANTAPVAFGAVGIPIIALAKAVNLPAEEISAMTGRMLPPLTIFVPFFIIFLMSGWKGVKETFPAIFVASISFVITQYLTSNYHGPELPDILSAIVSIAATAIFLKVWKPKTIFRFNKDGEGVYVSENEIAEEKKYEMNKILIAWGPFLFLIIAVIVWQLPAFKALFGKEGILGFTNIVFSMSGLDKMVIQTAPYTLQDIPLKSTWGLSLIQTAGTAILVAAILSIFLLRANVNMVTSSIKETFKEMTIPIFTIGLVLAFAFVAKNSGQAVTLGLALAETTGPAFPFFSPVIGWIGVFLTGSDTSSNLLFGTLQQVTAHKLGFSDTLFMAANSVGGVVGKMISPQSIAIACAAVGLVGRESELFRFTVKYSIYFIIFIGIWTTIIAYLIPGMIVLPGSL